MTKLSLNKLKQIAKIRSIKVYGNKSEDDLIKIISEPKTKITLFKKRIKDINEKFNESRHRFCKSKINEIRRSIFDI